MRALIIDDSRLARQELKHLLKEHDAIEVVGEAADAEQALAHIHELRPDLLFLDIQMPGKDGFELLESLDDAPHVIFTTAYNEYALKAFEYSALDYLQKPLQKERLAVALEKLEHGTPPAARIDDTAPTELLTSNSQVFVKDGDHCWFVKLADIRLFEVDGSYTRIHFDSHSPMIPKALNYLESRLDPKTFFRANRQQMINLKWIDHIEPWFSGSLKINLKGGQSVEISRRQAAKFKDLLSF